MRWSSGKQNLIIVHPKMVACIAPTVWNPGGTCLSVRSPPINTNCAVRTKRLKGKKNASLHDGTPVSLCECINRFWNKRWSLQYSSTPSHFFQSKYWIRLSLLPQPMLLARNMRPRRARGQRQYFPGRIAKIKPEIRSYLLRS